VQKIQILWPRLSHFLPKNFLRPGATLKIWRLSSLSCKRCFFSLAYNVPLNIWHSFDEPAQTFDFDWKSQSDIRPITNFNHMRLECINAQVFVGLFVYSRLYLLTYLLAYLMIVFNFDCRTVEWPRCLKICTSVKKPQRMAWSCWSISVTYWWGVLEVILHGNCQERQLRQGMFLSSYDPMLLLLPVQVYCVFYNCFYAIDIVFTVCHSWLTWFS